MSGFQRSVGGVSADTQHGVQSVVTFGDALDGIKQIASGVGKAVTSVFEGVLDSIRTVTE